MTNDISIFFGRKITKYLLNELGDTFLTNSVVKVISDKNLVKKLPKGRGKVFDTKNSSAPIPIMFNAYKAYKENNPDIVKEIINNEEKDIEKMQEELSKLSGDEVFEYIYQDHDNRRIKLMSPKNAGVMTAVMLSARGFDKKIKKWLGETNAAYSIIMSIPNSVT